MAVPTLIIGLLPTYTQIGIWASILMLLCSLGLLLLIDAADPHAGLAALLGCLAHVPGTKADA